MKWKKFILIGFLLTGCISRREYAEQEERLKDLSAQLKSVRKEVKTLSAVNDKLADSLRVVIEKGKTQEDGLRRRLEKIGIKAVLKEGDLSKLSVRSPEMSDENYQWFLTRFTFADTNSARNTPWLSEQEKKMYYYLNFARMNPVGFCNKYLIPKVDRSGSQDIYLLTLIDYLYRMKPRNAIKPDKKLFDEAKCHAISSGKAGYIGHARQQKECRSSFSGECCAYGNSDALQVILQLLIDRSVSSLGHRYICLGWYEHAGISSAPHKGYGTNVVLDFR